MTVDIITLIEEILKLKSQRAELYSAVKDLIKFEDSFARDKGRAAMDAVELAWKQERLDTDKLPR